MSKRWSVSGAAAVTLLLGACTTAAKPGSEEPASASTSASTSRPPLTVTASTTAPSSTPPRSSAFSKPTPTGLPAEAWAKTAAGAEAYTTFYLSQVNEAYRAGAPGQVASLSLPTCKTCGGITETIRQLAASGQRYTGDFATPTSVTTSTIAEASAKTFVTTMTGQRQVLDSTGRTVDTVPASSINVSVSLVFGSTGWRISEIQSVQ